MNPEYPVYIISKGRWESRLTSKSLEKIGVPYSIIVEGSEYDRYASVIDPAKILVLPTHYQDSYNTCDDLGRTMSVGSGPARNFAWDHAEVNGAAKHWLLDDNIRCFRRFNRNEKIPVASGTIFKAAEDFISRYQNVPLAGFNYYFFCKKTEAIAPFYLNTRIYSCLLIDNGGKHRWRCRYNEDTDLSLRILKDGNCTILFNAFLADKVATQTMTGGNTEELYGNGTLDKSAMLVNLHPDCTKLVWRFDRWHHHVDYKPFRSNALIKRDGLDVPDVINNYGMRLVQR